MASNISLNLILLSNFFRLTGALSSISGVAKNSSKGNLNRHQNASINGLDLVRSLLFRIGRFFRVLLYAWLDCGVSRGSGFCCLNLGPFKAEVFDFKGNIFQVLPHGIALFHGFHRYLFYCSRNPIVIRCKYHDD